MTKLMRTIFSKFELRHCFVIRHSSFVIWFGLTFAAVAQSVFAIGGLDTPPPPSAPNEISFAAAKETKLENGLRVIVAQRPGLPLLAAQLLVRSGAESDQI